MLNEIEATKHELKINNKWYTFIFDLDSFLELERRYGHDAIVIFNQFLLNQNTTHNFIKILSCSCKNDYIDEQFLKDNLVFNKYYLNYYASITHTLMDGFIEESIEAIDEGVEKVKDIKIDEENKKKL